MLFSKETTLILGTRQEPQTPHKHNLRSKAKGIPETVVCSIFAFRKYFALYPIYHIPHTLYSIPYTIKTPYQDPYVHVPF